MTKLIKDNKIINFGDSIETKSHIIFNPTEQDYIDNGWIEYKEKLTLEEVKKNKINELMMYDSSEEINSFSINGYSLWLNPTERKNILEYIESVLYGGATLEDNIQYPFMGILIKAPIGLIKSKILEISLYAGNAKKTTDIHIMNINKLTSVEEVNNYNFKVDYPEKIIIKL